ncbi:hypothetical protein [Clostridium thailandense]|uniref:hypothetical protein n=1 Tax=Clostridium thailandense TaxID=2794346 RepID=UPI0039892C12
MSKTIESVISAINIAGDVSECQYSTTKDTSQTIEIITDKSMDLVKLSKLK